MNETIIHKQNLFSCLRKKNNYIKLFTESYKVTYENMLYKKKLSFIQIMQDSNRDNREEQQKYRRAGTTIYLI